MTKSTCAVAVRFAPFPVMRVDSAWVEVSGASAAAAARMPLTTKEVRMVLELPVLVRRGVTSWNESYGPVPEWPDTYVTLLAAASVSQAARKRCGPKVGRSAQTVRCHRNG